MASILESVLDEKIAVNDVVLWLLSKGDNSNIPEDIKQYNKVRQEFVPYFLNYLRDQTLHLLQNSKSFNSPSKTPSSVRTSKDSDRKVNRSKRTQLFERSPFESSSNSEMCTPILSPYNGNESPLLRSCADRGKKSDYRSGQNKHKSPNVTPDPNRSKHKLCLGEYLVSPDPSQRRKSSQSPGYPGYRSSENSPSPSAPDSKGKGSAGKKRATLYPASGKAGGKWKEMTPVFRLSDNDFPPVASNSRDETAKPKRRINPTQLLPDAKKYAAAKFQKLAEVVEKTPSKVPTRSQSDSVLPNVDSDGICLADERELLRKEKAKRQQATAIENNSSCFNNNACTPSKSKFESQLSSSSCSSEIVTAKTESVTFQSKLNLLADLYSRCLDEHLFPNLSVEIYFLIQLLTSISEESNVESQTLLQDSEDLRLFISVHNTVYFSVSVLNKQLNLLKYLDKSVLKLLAENKRISDFSPTLQSGLLQLYETASSFKTSSYCPRSPIGGVSFQADTDNRKNFPNDRVFHLFKKQRDLFYELIREWEAKRLSNGWSVGEMLGEKIRSLINTKTDLANYLHFARLFLSQLITMCKGDGTIRTDDDDDNIALLAHLKKTNPDKFKRLQERFIQPFSVGGPCPASSFPGNQEFFKEFIVAASSPVFNQHLSNIFTAKIKKLNDTEFSQNPSEENQETGSNQDQHQLFATCLLTLRLLGKFLGFVTFLPYQTQDVLPESMQSSYMELRNNECYPLNVEEFIHVSYTTCRLTVTIPWVVEYMSMMDKTAPQLHYYHHILHLLHIIHRFSWQKIKTDSFEFGHLLLVAMLGWLFENVVMENHSVFAMDFMDEMEPYKNLESTLKAVDSLELVNQELLFTVCPYLGEARTLLVEFAVGTNSRPNIRKITPVAADDFQEPIVSTNLQTQLEENFFHNHPASMKRTVEFVSERTASNFIKRFRATDLPTSIEEAKTRFDNLFQISSPTSKWKDRSQLDCKKLAKTICEEVRNKVASSKREYCLSRVNAALQLLLPDEQTPAVLAMASGISCRMSEERIKHWMNNHITTSMYLKEINGEADRQIKRDMLNKSPNKSASSKESQQINESLIQPRTNNSTSSESNHRDDLIPLSNLLSQLQNISRDLTVDGRCKVDETRLLMLLQNAHQVVLFKEDTIPQAVKSLAQIILDLCLLVSSCKPDLMTNGFLEACKNLWKTSLKHDTVFTVVSSMRWHHTLFYSSKKELTRKKYVIFVIMLLEEDIISHQIYENGCLKVLQSSLIFHDYIKVNLSDIENHFKYKNCERGVDFKETLNWIRLKKTDEKYLNDKLQKLSTGT